MAVSVFNFVWYAWQGSNLRPSVPETDALVQLSYRRTATLQPDGKVSQVQSWCPYVSVGNRGIMTHKRIQNRDRQTWGEIAAVEHPFAILSPRRKAIYC